MEPLKRRKDGHVICPHNKRRTRCKACGGNSICEHDKIRSTCKECGGTAICVHGQRKTRCKECGGQSICPHDKLKTRCGQCKPVICWHEISKAKCSECKGKVLCFHRRPKNTCNLCNDTMICDHSVKKSSCPECRTSLIETQWDTDSEEDLEIKIDSKRVGDYLAEVMDVGLLDSPTKIFDFEEADSPDTKVEDVIPKDVKPGFEIVKVETELDHAIDDFLQTTPKLSLLSNDSNYPFRFNDDSFMN